LHLAAPRAPVLFYCHFPDQLLAPPPSRTLAGRLRALYRAPLDALEQATTGAADRVLVNSQFTAAVFARAFPRLAVRGVSPAVLHPAAAIPAERALQRAADTWREVLPADVVALVEGGGPVFLSINRFETKKGLPLALDALAALPRSAPAPVLIFAGGYDARLPDNVAVLASLKARAAALGLTARVAFLPSFAEPQKAALLAVATAVLYTPQGEHFGIVPVEAAAARVPVVACASGGPVESIADGVTGWLVAPDAAAFAAAAARVLGPGGPAVAARVAAAARERAVRLFSRTAFGAKLEAEVVALVDGKQERGKGGKRG
jgi:alpha-1,3/alpha-1,6-mannosyltransferase